MCDLDGLIALLLSAHVQTLPQWTSCADILRRTCLVGGNTWRIGIDYISNTGLLVSVPWQTRSLTFAHKLNPPHLGLAKNVKLFGWWACLHFFENMLYEIQRRGLHVRQRFKARSDLFNDLFISTCLLLTSSEDKRHSFCTPLKFFLSILLSKFWYFVAEYTLEYSFIPFVLGNVA